MDIDQSSTNGPSVVLGVGLTVGLKGLGLDVRPVHLLSGVKAALDDPQLATRWLAGEQLPDEIVNHETIRRAAEVEKALYPYGR